MAPPFPKAPFIFDGGKPNSVGVIAHADDHLSHPAPVLLATRQDRHLHSQNWGWTSGEFSLAMMRRYPRIKRASYQAGGAKAGATRVFPRCISAGSPRK